MSFLQLASRPRRSLFRAYRCFSTGSALPINRSVGSVSSAASTMTAQAPDKELGVGELEGASFRVEPIRRSGEDIATRRARLLYQSRKRGTLESDLLLSTFADVHLGSMNAAQLEQYDRFLDENDWDIYYWATQEPTPAAEQDEALAEGSSGKSPVDTAEWTRPQVQGEWAQTVGAFKPAYRPVPSRWRNSEILAMLRKHVKERSAGGVHEAVGEGQEAVNTGGRGGGLGMMPKIKHFDA